MGIGDVLRLPLAENGKLPAYKKRIVHRTMRFRLDLTFTKLQRINAMIQGLRTES